MSDLVARGLGQNVLADVLGEDGEDTVVVLEEGPGRVDELEVVDVFCGFGVGICNADFAMDVVASVFDYSVGIFFFGHVIF